MEVELQTARALIEDGRSRCGRTAARPARGARSAGTGGSTGTEASRKLAERPAAQDARGTSRRSIPPCPANSRRKLAIGMCAELTGSRRRASSSTTSCRGPTRGTPPRRSGWRGARWRWATACGRSTRSTACPPARAGTRRRRSPRSLPARSAAPRPTSRCSKTAGAVLDTLELGAEERARLTIDLLRCALALVEDDDATSADGTQLAGHIRSRRTTCGSGSSARTARSRAVRDDRGGPHPAGRLGEPRPPEDVDVSGAIAYSCPLCAATALPGDRFCEQCGGRLAGEPCAACGAPAGEIDPDGYCMRCGVRDRAAGRPSRDRRDDAPRASATEAACEPRTRTRSISTRSTRDRRGRLRRHLVVGTRRRGGAPRRPDGRGVTSRPPFASRPPTCARPWRPRSRAAQGAVARDARRHDLRRAGLHDRRRRRPRPRTGRRLGRRQPGVLARRARASQLTSDDSWAAEQVRAGLLTAVEAAAPRRTRSRAGWAATHRTRRRTSCRRAGAGGRLVLCTDGLWNYVPQPRLSSALHRLRLERAPGCRRARGPRAGRGRPRQHDGPRYRHPTRPGGRRMSRVHCRDLPERVPAGRRRRGQRRRHRPRRRRRRAVREHRAAPPRSSSSTRRARWSTRGPSCARRCTRPSVAIDSLRDGVAFGVIAGTHEASAVYPQHGRLVAASPQTRARPRPRSD